MTYPEMVSFVLAQVDGVTKNIILMGTNLEKKVNDVSVRMDMSIRDIITKLDATQKADSEKQQHELELVRMAKRSTVPTIIAMVAALASVVGVLASLHIHFGS